MRPSILYAALAALILPGVVAGCGERGGTVNQSRSLSQLAPFQGEYPIRVACTTGMVADVVANVGGEHVALWEVGDLEVSPGGDHLRITQLMGEGVDPHLYKASPGDLSILDQADLIFYSGLQLEGKLADVFVRMARRKPTFAVTERLPRTAPDKLQEVEEGYYDPHIWFDVALWSETVDVVADALARFDPEHASDYRKNAEAYREMMVELDEYCRRRIGTIPEERRVLVTAHDAFHYFGRAYDIEVRAIQGISTASEASAKKIEQLVDYIVERKIKAVFVETSVADRNIQLVIEGCRARGHDVRIGGELFSDAMGRLGTEEGTYRGMVRHNVETIVSALK